MQALRCSATRASSIDCFVIFVCPLLLYQNIIKSRMFATVQITADWTLLMSPTELLILLWLVFLVLWGTLFWIWDCRRYYLPNLICEPPHLARSRSKKFRKALNKILMYYIVPLLEVSPKTQRMKDDWIQFASDLSRPYVMNFITRCVKSTCKSNQLGCQINSSIYWRPSLLLPYPLSG